MEVEQESDGREGDYALVLQEKLKKVIVMMSFLSAV